MRVESLCILHKHLRMRVGESNGTKIINIIHILEGIEGVETQKAELWGKVISLRGDRCCETTEPGVNPCECARVGNFPVRSSREWSGGFALLYSLSYNVCK